MFAGFSFTLVTKSLGFQPIDFLSAILVRSLMEIDRLTYDLLDLFWRKRRSLNSAGGDCLQWGSRWPICHSCNGLQLDGIERAARYVGIAVRQM